MTTSIEKKFSHLPDIRTLQPDRLFKRRISDDRFAAEVLLPGFTYTDFDQKIGGKPPLHAIADLFYCARVTTAGFWLFDKITDDQTAYFVVSQSYSFAKDIEAFTLSSNFNKERSLRAIIYLAYVGRTSKTMGTDLYDPISGRLIATNLSNVVLMNKTLRRPVPLPRDPAINKAIDAHLATLKHTPIPRWSAPEIPDKAFKYYLQGVFSESDQNDHINQTVFNKWCTDAASMAALDGKLPCYTRPIGWYPLKSSVGHYTGEVFAGDRVDVYVWEDQSASNCLQFVMKKGDTVVYLGRMEFYASDVDLSKL